MTKRSVSLATVAAIALAGPARDDSFRLTNFSGQFAVHRDPATVTFVWYARCRRDFVARPVKRTAAA